MPIARPVRTLRAPALLAAVLVPLALLSLPGCDEVEKLDPSEQRLHLGISRPTVCPTEPLGDPLNTVVLVATVFGEDGQVAADIPVEIIGENEQNEVVYTLSGDTNDVGQFRTSFQAEGGPETLTFTASIPAGETATARIEIAPAPTLTLSSRVGARIPLDTESFEIDVNLFSACRVNSLSFDLTYNTGEDGEVIHFVDAVPGLLDFDADGTGSVEVETDLEAQAITDRRLSVRYSRVDPASSTSADGVYLTLLFRPVAIGQTTILPEDVIVTTGARPDEMPEEYRLSELDPPRVFGTAITVAP
jgi:hypothetical protein